MPDKILELSQKVINTPALTPLTQIVYSKQLHKLVKTKTVAILKEKLKYPCQVRGHNNTDLNIASCTSTTRD